MRKALLLPFVAVLVAGCQPEAPPPPVEPRTSTALVGRWLRQAPAALRGDTLVLRSDSTASALIVWNEDEVARATHWTTRFASKTPTAERADWRQGYTDGGDPECVFGPSQAGCVSLPMLCIGAAKQQACQAFAYVAPDSLLLPDGSVFVRLPPPPVVALSR